MTPDCLIADQSTILVVEDEPAVRRSLQLLLQGHGVRVRSHGSAAAALADPLALAADGLIADYRLPDSDGIALLGKLRQKGFAGPAILVTAFEAAGLDREASAAGFHRVLHKPLADQGVTVALRKLLPDGGRRNIHR